MNAAAAVLLTKPFDERALQQALAQASGAVSANP